MLVFAIMVVIQISYLSIHEINKDYSDAIFITSIFVAIMITSLVGGIIL